VVGPSVLDVGCGYGSLCAFLSAAGMKVHGIDSDVESISVAKTLFPDLTVENTTLEKYSGSMKYNTIVLKDVFHHLCAESEIGIAVAHITGLLVDHGRLVVVDPNPNVILRLCRKIISHDDPEARADSIRSILDRHGFRTTLPAYFESIGLPLSGGYVGWRVIPNYPACNAFVTYVNLKVTSMINKLKLGRYLCWRYLIVADKLDDQTGSLQPHGVGDEVCRNEGGWEWLE
jgi:SAM-dependent methyltransferase